MIISETIDKPIPSKSNSYRIGNKRLYKSQTLVEFEEYFTSVTSYSSLKINEPFSLKVDVYMKNKRQDIDNTLKILLDCLEKNEVITNDNLCYHIDITKHIEKEKPRVEYTLETIKNDL